MSYRSKFFLLLLVLTTALNSVYSQPINIGDLAGTLNSIRVAVPFLVIAPDSRAGAMGDVGAASTPDVL
jgi:hypothetical protein